MIRRGFLIAGGLLAGVVLAMLAWPSALSEVSAVIGRTVSGDPGPTLPAVIAIRARGMSDARQSAPAVVGDPLVAGQPQPLPSRAPADAGDAPAGQPATPSVVTPPVYTYTAPPSGDGGGGDGGSHRGPGKSPSPSPGR